MAKNFGIVNPDEYRGLTLEEATKLAENNGFTSRVAERDGQALMLTMELKSNRLNFRVMNNVIIEAYPG